MRRPILVSALALASLAAVPAQGDAQQIVGRSDRIFTTTSTLAAGGTLRIFSRNGAITISEATGNTVDYRAEKDARRGDIEDVGFIVKKDGDGTTICAVFNEDDECDSDGVHGERRSSRNWGRRDQVKVNITVKVPRGAKLYTSTGNGDVAVNAAVAEARISSGNGRVKVTGVAGRVDASSGNGEVSVDHAGGAVSAHSGNGEVTIGTTNGPVNASSGNGDIVVSMDRLSGNEDMEFSSGNGRIEIEVPADFSAEVEANSGNGKVMTDFPITVRGRLTPSRLRGTIGNGGRRLRLSTGNGTIEIRKKV